MQTLLTVSEASGTAATDATEYARRLAIGDALVAGRDAARTASKWITIGSYGVGAAPIFDGASTQMIAIDLSGVSGTYHGGWKIDNVEIKNYLWTGVRAASFTHGAARGLWLTSTVSIHNITGYNFNKTPPYTNLAVPGSVHFAPMGVDTYGTRNVDLAGTYNSNDTPYYVQYSDDTVIDGANAQHSNYLHPYVSAGTRNLIRNSTYDHMCDGPGLTTGSAGMLLSLETDVILYNNVFSFTPKRTQDGSGIDFEAQDITALFLANNVHDNDDAAVELLANPGSENGTMLVGNVFTNNGIGYTTNTVGNVIFINYAPPDTLDHLILVNNNITKATSPAQSWLFSARNTTLTNTITDIWSNNPIFGPDNTVH